MSSNQRRRPAPKKSYLTTAQVAEQLQVDESTIRRWIVDGRLPATRPGRGYRVNPDDLDELLQLSTASQPLTVKPKQQQRRPRQSQSVA